MTIKIEIEAHPDRGDMGDQIKRAMSALGYYRATVKPTVDAAKEAFAGRAHTAEEAEVREVPGVKSSNVEQEPYDAEDDGTRPEPPEEPTRDRGKPSEGKARRTKAEIAEDEAADAADAAAAADKPAISSGENRVGPEDDAETEAADAEDEKAETDKTGLAPIDQLRRAMGAYQKAFGMPAAVKLVEEGGLIGCGVTELDEADIPDAVERVNAAIAAKGGKTETKASEPAATKEDAVAAMKRYALEFDGQNTDPAAMPFTMEDCPKIFGMLFGAGITKISHVPADGYGKVVAAIDEAIQKDPFKRGAE